MLEKLRKPKKKTQEVTIKPRIRYQYLDYIHPSYFKGMTDAKKEIVCNYCKKVQGEVKFDVCSACKKTYYCSKDCQVKDWKAGHKAQCPHLRGSV